MALTNIEALPESAASPAHDWRALLERAQRLARGFLRDDELAREVAQAAVVEAFIKRPSIENLSAWLAVVVRRKCWRLVTRRAPVGGEIDARRADRDGVEEGPCEVRILMREIFERLSREQARLLELAARGYTHRELAECFGCQVHQVGPRLARARRAALRVAEAKPGDRQRARSAHRVDG